MNSKKKTILVVIVTALVTVNLTVLGVITVLSKQGYIVYPSKYSIKVDKLLKIKQMLKNNYVDKINDDKLYDGMYKGLVDSIKDPYTIYMNQNETKQFMEEVTGSYAGVGIVMGADAKKNRIIVAAAFKGGPANKSGIKPGDEIQKINSINITSKDMEKARSLMKGKVGKKIKLTIYRPSVKEIMVKDVVTDEVSIPTVDWNIQDKKIGYIRISQFAENTSKEFSDALDSLLSKRIKGLIIDVRDNPGGYYDEVVKICDRILPKDTIVYTIDNKKHKEVSSSDNKQQLKMPIAVLVNGQSASASEILSGALKDNKKAVLVGTRTFGKGLVQKPFELSDGSLLKITVARYYTPSGVCIQGKGIKPNITVKLPNNIQSVLDLQKGEKDTQLDSAIKYVKAKI